MWFSLIVARWKYFWHRQCAVQILSSISQWLQFYVWIHSVHSVCLHSIGLCSIERHPPSKWMRSSAVKSLGNANRVHSIFTLARLLTENTIQIENGVIRSCVCLRSFSHLICSSTLLRNFCRLLFKKNIDFCADWRLSREIYLYRKCGVVYLW